MPLETKGHSFVLRLIHQRNAGVESETSPNEWHGTIKYIQTNTQQHFTGLSEALAFIRDGIRAGESARQENGFTQDDQPSATPKD